MAVNAIYGHDTMMTDELFHGYELAAFNLNGKCTMETIFSRIFGNFRESSGIFGNFREKWPHWRYRRATAMHLLFLLGGIMATC